jgi:hypothetical protein
MLIDDGPAAAETGLGVGTAPGGAGVLAAALADTAAVADIAAVADTAAAVAGIPSGRREPTRAPFAAPPLVLILWLGNRFRSRRRRRQRKRRHQPSGAGSATSGGGSSIAEAAGPRLASIL